MKFFLQDNLVVKDILAGSYLRVCKEQASTLGDVAVVLEVLSNDFCTAWFPAAAPWLKLPQQAPGIDCFTTVFVTTSV